MIDWRWKDTFVKEVTGPVAEFMALTKPVKYSEVIELDRKIREYNMKPVPAELLATDADMVAILRRSTLGVYREIGKVHLPRHILYFAYHYGMSSFAISAPKLLCESDA